MLFRSNGGYYTNNLGTINNLPTRSSSALLNGYVVNSPNGPSPADGSVVIGFFQQPEWPGSTYGYTTTGYPYYSYAAPPIMELMDITTLALYMQDVI